MKNFKNILKKDNSNWDLDLDQVLNNNNLKFTDLDFNSENPDVLKSFNSLNQKLGKNSGFIKNLKSILPEINFTPILKPIYTVVLTTIIILSVIQYRNYIKPLQYAEINVKKGEKINLHVTDNLVVYLNSESTIKIPLELKRNSEIILEGEAYFELKENKNIKINVAGILINGNNSNFYLNTLDNNQLTAQVFNGNIDFYNPVLPESTKINLKTNDKVSYNYITQFIAVENNTNKNIIAWHTGIMSFKNDRLSSVIDEISSYFDIPIEIQNKEIVNKLFTAQFTQFEIDNILDKIQLAFNCTINTDGSKIIIN